MKKLPKRKKTVRIAAASMAAVIFASSYLFSVPGFSYETFDYIKNLKNSKKASGESYNILEVVPDENAGTIGYYVGGSEPDWAQDLGSIKTEAKRKEYLKKLSDKLVGSSDTAAPLRGNINNYEETYPWTAEGSRGSASVLLDEYELVDGVKGTAAEMDGGAYTLNAEFPYAGQGSSYDLDADAYAYSDVIGKYICEDSEKWTEAGSTRHWKYEGRGIFSFNACGLAVTYEIATQTFNFNGTIDNAYAGNANNCFIDMAKFVYDNPDGDFYNLNCEILGGNFVGSLTPVAYFYHNAIMNTAADPNSVNNFAGNLSGEVTNWLDIAAGTDGNPDNAAFNINTYYSKLGLKFSCYYEPGEVPPSFNNYSFRLALEKTSDNDYVTASIQINAFSNKQWKAQGDNKFKINVSKGATNMAVDYDATTKYFTLNGTFVKAEGTGAFCFDNIYFDNPKGWYYELNQTAATGTINKNNVNGDASNNSSIPCYFMNDPTYSATGKTGLNNYPGSLSKNSYYHNDAGSARILYSNASHIGFTMQTWVTWGADSKNNIEYSNYRFSVTIRKAVNYDALRANIMMEGSKQYGTPVNGKGWFRESANNMSTYKLTKGGFTLTYDANSTTLTINGSFDHSATGISISDYCKNPDSGNKTFCFSLEYLSGTYTSSAGFIYVEHYTHPTDTSAPYKKSWNFRNKSDTSQSSVYTSEANDRGFHFSFWTSNINAETTYTNAKYKVSLYAMEKSEPSFRAAVDNPVNGWSRQSDGTYRLNKSDAYGVDITYSPMEDTFKFNGTVNWATAPGGFQSILDFVCANPEGKTYRINYEKVGGTHTGQVAAANVVPVLYFYENWTMIGSSLKQGPNGPAEADCKVGDLASWRTTYTRDTTAPMSAFSLKMYCGHDAADTTVYTFDNYTFRLGFDEVNPAAAAYPAVADDKDGAYFADVAFEKIPVGTAIEDGTMIYVPAWNHFRYLGVAGDEGLVLDVNAAYYTIGRVKRVSPVWSADTPYYIASVNKDATRYVEKSEKTPGAFSEPQNEYLRYVGAGKGTYDFEASALGTSYPVYTNQIYVNDWYTNNEWFKKYVLDCKDMDEIDVVVYPVTASQLNANPDMVYGADLIVISAGYDLATGSALPYGVDISVAAKETILSVISEDKKPMIYDTGISCDGCANLIALRKESTFTNLLKTTGASTSGKATSQDGYLEYTVNQAKDKTFSITGNYFPNSTAGGGSNEVTASVPLCVDLETGKDYTISFTSTNKISEFYFFLNGSSSERACVNYNNALLKRTVTTEYGQTLYYYETVFGLGNTAHMGDVANGFKTPGKYYLRFDQNCLKEANPAVQEYAITNLAIRDNDPVTRGVIDSVYFFSTQDIDGCTGFVTPKFIQAIKSSYEPSFQAVTDEIDSENAIRQVKDPFIAQSELIPKSITMGTAIRCIINYPGRMDLYTKEKIDVLEIEPNSNVSQITVDQIYNWINYTSGGISTDRLQNDAQHIVIHTMAAAEFIMNMDDLVEKYDLIYIGDSLDNMNTKTVNDKTISNYTDDSMDGMVYTNIGDLYYSISGSRESMSRNTPVLGGMIRDDYTSKEFSDTMQIEPSDGYDNCYWVKLRLSGNDITPQKMQELINAADVGIPVIVADDLVRANRSWQGTLSATTTLISSNWLNGSCTIEATLNPTMALPACVTPVFTWYRWVNNTYTLAEGAAGTTLDTGNKLTSRFSVKAETGGAYFAVITFRIDNTAADANEYSRFKDVFLYSQGMGVWSFEGFKVVGDHDDFDYYAYLYYNKNAGVSTTTDWQEFTIDTTLGYWKPLAADSWPANPSSMSATSNPFAATVESFTYGTSYKSNGDKQQWNHHERKILGINSPYANWRYKINIKKDDISKTLTVEDGNSNHEDIVNVYCFFRQNFNIDLSYGNGMLGGTVEVGVGEYANAERLDNASNWYQCLGTLLNRKKNVMSLTEATKTTGQKDYLWNCVNFSQPTVTIENNSDREENYNELTNPNGKIIGNTMELDFSITNPSDNTPSETRYEVFLYFDADGDGYYSEDEQIDNLKLYAQNEYGQWGVAENGTLRTSNGNKTYKYRLNRGIPAAFAGVIPWRLMIVKVGDAQAHCSHTAYAYYEPVEPQVVRVIQILKGNQSPAYDATPEIATGSIFFGDSIANLDGVTKYTNASSDIANVIAEVDRIKEVSKNTALAHTGSTLAANEVIYKVRSDFYLDIFVTNSDAMSGLSDPAAYFSQYDMMIVGFGDGWASAGISEAAAKAINWFKDTGKPTLFTHDTTTYINCLANSQSDLKKNGYYMNKWTRSGSGIDRYGAAYVMADLTPTFDRLCDSSHHDGTVDGLVTYSYDLKDKSAKETHGIYAESKYSAAAMTAMNYDVAYLPGTNLSSNLGVIEATPDFRYVQGFTRYTAVRFNMPYVYGHGNLTSGFGNNQLRPTLRGDYRILHEVTRTGAMGTADGIFRDSDWSSCSQPTYTTEITQVNKGQITTYPFNLNIDELQAAGIVQQGHGLNIQSTHEQYYQLNVDDPAMRCWFCLGGSNYANDIYNDAVNNYYIYTLGNVTYTGSGHLNKLSETEAKLMLNTVVCAYRSAIEAPAIAITEDDGYQDVGYRLLTSTEATAANADARTRIYFYLYDKNVDEIFQTGNLVVNVYDTVKENDAYRLLAQITGVDNTLRVYDGAGVEADITALKMGELYHFNLSNGIVAQLMAHGDVMLGLSTTASTVDDPDTVYVGNEAYITLRTVNYLPVS